MFRILVLAIAVPLLGFASISAFAAGTSTPGPAETSGEQAVALAKAVQARYEKWQDFSADFIQLYTKTALSRTTESRGQLVFEKPGKLRIQYTRPTENLFVADGETLWVYEPEERQVFVRKGYDAAEHQSALAFLHGKGDLREAYGIRRLPPGTHGISKDLALLELVPKKDTAYAKLVLAVVPESGDVRETWLFLTSGDINRWVLRKPKINRGVPDGRFRFDIPRGVEVIEAP